MPSVPTLVTAPTDYPVTVEEARDWCGFFDDDSHDHVLRALIKGATEEAENETWSRFITQTWKQYWDTFADPLVLSRPPLHSSGVSSLKYIDANGDEQTVATSVYETGTTKAGLHVIRLQYGQSWPTPRGHEDDVYATYVSGYGGRSAVPQTIKDAILIHVAHSIQNREGEKPLPDAFRLMLRPYSYRRSLPVEE